MLLLNHGGSVVGTAAGGLVVRSAHFFFRTGREHAEEKSRGGLRVFLIKAVH